MSELARLTIEERGDVVVAHVTGELDLAQAPRTGEAILESVARTARGLLVDLTGLDFIDSSGVAMLFNLHRRLSTRRQQLRVATVPESAVARVLEIVNMDRAAPIEASVEDALAAFHQPTGG